MEDSQLWVDYPEAEDDSFFEDEYHLDEWDDDDLYDDICCFDPRYTGPSGSCRCRDFEEERTRSMSWYNRTRERLWAFWFNTKLYWTTGAWKEIFRKQDDGLPF